LHYQQINVAYTYLEKPRFGRPHDFAQGLFGDAGDMHAYFRGFLWVGMLIAVIYALWLGLVLMWWYMGRERVGFLSGEPFVIPKPARAKRISKLGTEHLEFASQDSLSCADGGNRIFCYRDVPSFSNRPARVRILYITCGLVFILFAILMVTQGISKLNKTLSSFADVADDLDDISNRISSIVNDGMPVAANSTAQILESIVKDVNSTQFCPNDPTLKKSTTGQAFRKLMVGLRNDLVGIDAITGNDASNVREAIKTSSAMTSGLRLTMDHLSGSSWKALLVIIPSTLIPLLLVIGVVLAMLRPFSEIYSCFIDWVLAPLFFVMVAMLWIAVTAIAIFAGMNGDFCQPGGRESDTSPSNTIRDILQRQDLDPFFYTLGNWYISQCQSSIDPFAFYNGMSSILVRLKVCKSTCNGQT
jgi:hypothetical protein